jgi:hypothetical protein
MALGKYVGRVAALCGALCIAATLAFVPVAAAYPIPKLKPGSPGGPPKPPKGGTGTTKGVAKKVGNDLAGLTDLELAKLGKVTVNFSFPKAGTVSCTVTAGKTKIGSGSATSTATKKSSKKLTIKFSSSGVAFLKKNNGKATQLTISCTFKPKKGKSSTSTTELKTFP